MNEDNFYIVNKIYTKLSESIPEPDRLYLINIDNLFYLVNKENTIHHLISYKNNEYRVNKLIELVEQLILVKECEFDKFKWLDFFYKEKDYPKVENNFKYFMLTSINKLLKENKELKDRIEYLESKTL